MSHSSPNQNLKPQLIISVFRGEKSCSFRKSNSAMGCLGKIDTNIESGDKRNKIFCQQDLFVPIFFKYSIRIGHSGTNW